MTPKKKILVISVVALSAFPLLFLIYKSYNAKPLDEKPVIAAVSTDIGSLEALVQKDPSFDNLINLSMAYVNNQMPGKSIDYLKRAIQLNPNSAIAYNNIGVAYTMLQQYQNGIDACSKAIQIDTSFQLAKNNLRWASDEKNKVLAAITEYEKVEKSKRDVAFYTAYGLCFFKIGDYGKSIEVWNKIFELDVKNVTALNNIGTAFMMKGQIDDAVLLFKKAIELEPDNQLAKNNLKWASDEKAKEVKLN